MAAPVSDNASDDAKIIEHLKACRRNQAETIRELMSALEAIRDLAMKAIGELDDHE